jgi:hypothetical protein
MPKGLFLSHTFCACFICTLSSQVANISDMAIVTLSIDSNSIISLQGTPVSAIAPVTFLYGKIYISLQTLQRYDYLIILWDQNLVSILFHSTL